MGKRLWFNVALCDHHWSYIYPEREPIRLREGVVEDTCVRCGEPASIYVRTCWPPEN